MSAEGRNLVLGRAMFGRGAFQDIVIAVADGLKGFAEAITAAFLQTTGADLQRASRPPLAQRLLAQDPQGTRPEAQT